MTALAINPKSRSVAAIFFMYVPFILMEGESLRNPPDHENNATSALAASGCRRRPDLRTLFEDAVLNWRDHQREPGDRAYCAAITTKLVCPLRLTSGTAAFAPPMASAAISEGAIQRIPANCCRMFFIILLLVAAPLD
jgi:hypothetical protein